MKTAEMTSLAALARQLAAGETSSVLLTEQALKRIQERDDTLGCFLHLDAAQALAQARAADERRQHGKTLSLIDGIPLGIKDNILQEGVPTTAGSKILENYLPPFDATVVKKLKEAGAVLLGKLNLDEFAMGSSTENSAYRVCRNPHDEERTPGGSSGGSAASVAAGFCAGSLGTDTGGSIRQPASFCGVVGIKPTYGRVSRFGVVAYASSLDQVGPLAADVESAALLLDTISGFDPRDSTSVDMPATETVKHLRDQKDLAGMRIGLPHEYADESALHPDVAAALEHAKKALMARGATLVDISLPHTKYCIAAYYIVATAEASSNLARYDGIRYGPRADAKNLAGVYEETRGQFFGDEVKRRLMLGTYVLSAGYYDAYYVKAQKVRRLLAEDFRKAFDVTQGGVDAILCPTAPAPAFKIGEKTGDPLQMYLSDIFTISANLAGIPAISLNAGWSSAVSSDENSQVKKLPVGVQLMGNTFDEVKLLQIAHHLEQELKQL